MSRYLIVGYGGIGKAVAASLRDAGHEVTVVNRTKVEGSGFDVYGFAELDSLLNQNMPDYIIVATGMLFNDSHGPEKSVADFSEHWLNENSQANLMPSVLVAQKISSLMTRSSKIKMLCISARVSSITDNRLGGWYSYRMSKCALNMFVKNLSIEWRRNFPESVVLAYHPGTVDTPLSEPYSKKMDPSKLFSTEKAADLLLKNFDKADLQHSGCLIDWRGDILDF